MRGAGFADGFTCGHVDNANFPDSAVCELLGASHDEVVRHHVDLVSAHFTHVIRFASNKTCVIVLVVKSAISVHIATISQPLPLNGVPPRIDISLPMVLKILRGQLISEEEVLFIHVHRDQQTRILVQFFQASLRLTIRIHYMLIRENTLG